MSTPTLHKGRGALTNPEGRFETQRREEADDGWYRPEGDEALPPIETVLRPDPSRSIITRNQSPDIPFAQSINPYKGCEHGCIYCLSGDTPVLMADGSTQPLADIRTHDEVYGTQRRGWYRRYVKTQVLAHWRVRKPAWRIRLQDGTELIAGGDHRFLTERGWKFVTAGDAGQRPHLTRNNKFMGTGRFADPPEKNSSYARGYLSGLIRGDGLLGEYHYHKPDRGRRDNQYHFRLALTDEAALMRARAYLSEAGIRTRLFLFQKARERRRAMQAIGSNARDPVERIHRLIAWPGKPSLDWHRGFLAGIFDAEGSYSQGVLRISNTDNEIIRCIEGGLRRLGFRWAREKPARHSGKPITVLRLLGGLQEQLRFFHATDPAIARKRAIEGMAVKSSAALKVVSIESLGTRTLYDISTGTEDFIANGVVSHNCYARPSHAYLNLSPGLDFETKIFYKERAAELLDQELRKPGYRPAAITVGANTDPYQPAERKLKVTRGILEVLQRFRHPVSIITKSALVTRDLDILADMAREGLAAVFITVTTLDNDLKRHLEPRAASPASRFKAMEALAKAGVPVGVMNAPIIPAINDAEMERILELAASAGARGAGYTLLRLPYELKDLFREWLAAHYPLKAEHVMSIIRQSRNGKDYDSGFGTRFRGTGQFAELIGKRFALAVKRHNLGFRGMRLSTEHFTVPPEGGQMELW